MERAEPAVSLISLIRPPHSGTAPVHERSCPDSSAEMLAQHRGRAKPRMCRDLLDLYATTTDVAARRQIEGILSVNATRVVRRLPGHGPIAFGRGVQIAVEVDEMAFEGASAFLLGAVQGPVVAATSARDLRPSAAGLGHRQARRQTCLLHACRARTTAMARQTACGRLPCPVITGPSIPCWPLPGQGADQGRSR